MAAMADLSQRVAELSLSPDDNKNLQKEDLTPVQKRVKKVIKNGKEDREKKEKKKRVKEDPLKDSDGNPFKSAVDWKDYPQETYHSCTGKGGCGLVKPKSSFVKDKAVKAGVRNICKLCKNKSIRNKNMKKNSGI